MFKNFSKILFFFMLFLSAIMTISANSWFSMWMGLEINLLSFIPLMMKKMNLNNSESTLNYFMIQAFTSTIILFSIILKMIYQNLNFFFYNMIILNYNMISFLIMLTLMFKIGAAPFHMWLPNIMENISWMNNLILMTWQKLAPMMLLLYINNLYKLLMIFMLTSILIGAISGLNQISLRKLLAFSSINHMGWMFSTILFNENLWFLYFLIYSFMNFNIIILFKIFQIFYLTQMYSLFKNSYLYKFIMLMLILSMGGLPPFMGFIPKWLIIQSLMFMKMNFINMFMIYASFIVLYYYLKISFSAFLMNYMELNWNFKNYYNIYYYFIMNNMTFFSLSSFFIVIKMIY